MPHISWLSMHGALTHFPIAMLIAGFLFEFGAALFKKPEWRIVSFWLLVTAVVTSAPSLLTGWMTGSKLYGTSANPPSVFTTHRLMAFVTSGLALLVLLVRMSVRDKASGAGLAASIIAAFGLVCIVSYTGYLGGEMTLGEAGDDTTSSAAPPPSAVAQAGPALDPALIAKGKLVYAANGCSGCHKIDGDGGHGGPNLSHEGTHQPDLVWQSEHIKDPQKVRPNSDMPAYGTLSDADLHSLAEYIVSMK